MKKLVYISGPITGHEDYKQEFDYAADKLISDGYTVVNPARIDDVMPNAKYEEYMKADMLLLGICDCIYMLKCWEKSCGANREYGYALAKGKEIMFE